MADRLGGMMQALSKAFLNLPVGEIEAAAKGRPATQADRRRTIRDLGRKQDPNFERNLDRDLATSRVTMQASMKAFAAALPAMIKALTKPAARSRKPPPTCHRRIIRNDNVILPKVRTHEQFGRSFAGRMRRHRRETEFNGTVLPERVFLLDSAIFQSRRQA